jgi:hypothetical protein
MKSHIAIPKSFPVQPLKPGENPPGKTTCGHCGLSWVYDVPISSRCPFEYFHLPVDQPDDPLVVALKSICINLNLHIKEHPTRYHGEVRKALQAAEKALARLEKK